jgi:hypothetical protein
MGVRGPFPERKARPGRDADHPLPSSAEVKKDELFSSPHGAYMAVAGQLYIGLWLVIRSIGLQ